MITLDWGNYEETVIILRIEGACSVRECELVSLKYRMMLMASTVPVNVIVDIRMAEKSLSQVFLFLSKELKNPVPNLNKIIVLGTSNLNRTMRIIENFYPELISNIIVTESVDDAYEFVVVA